MNALQQEYLVHSSTKANRKLLRNLHNLMEAKHLSEAELSRQTAIPQPTLHKIITGKTADPRISTLQTLAEFFRVSLDELMSGDPVSSNESQQLQTQSVPIVSWQDCLDGKLLSTLNANTWEEWIVVEERGDSIFALSTKPSMEPRFPKGTVLVIDPNIVPEDGDLVVVHYHDTKEATLRELLLDGPKKLLLNLNSDGESDELSDNLLIIGTVAQSRFSY